MKDANLEYDQRKAIMGHTIDRPNMARAVAAVEAGRAQEDRAAI